jgi:cell division protein ZapA
MAEDNKEKLNIKLYVYDEDIHVAIDRSEEHLYRNAAKLITERYGVYNRMFKVSKSDHTIALMTLVEIALRYERELDRNDTEPYDNILSQLTSEIEEALK